MKFTKKLFALLSVTLLFATLTSFRKKSLKDVEVIKNFNLNKYLGSWYEIARLDFKWEKNLEQVTATYSLRKDGKVKVDNKGYDTIKKKWQESIGKAKLVSGPDQGRLKVSFFGPFYAGYNIVAIDEQYKYALVVGESTDNMWILSREKTVPDKIKEDYLAKAKGLGIVTENLVWTKQ